MMVLNGTPNPRLVLLMALALLPMACSSQEVQKRRHFERGNEYAAAKRDEFAVIEYANAVRLDPKFGEARLKLAETYERMNNLRAAAPEFVRAADALPNNREVQIKATEILLLGGRFEDAKARATTLLTRNPKDIDALLLRADALAVLKDPTAAIAEIEEALKVQPNESRTFVNLGAIRMGSGDAKEAETAFRKAITLEPSSIDAHLAFANFLWSAGRPNEAEQELQQALTLDSRHLLANRMLGTLYMVTKRPEEAERPLKVVAEISKAPAARFQLVEYYLTVRRNEDAIKLLTELAADQATFVEAEAMLASLDYDGGRRQEAHARLDKLLARAPKDARALVIKARWLMNEKKLDEALDRAKAAVAADPQSAAAYFALGTAHDLRREVPDAVTAYNEVLRLNPRAVAAQVELSRLNLASGNRDAALHYAEEAKQTQPGNVSARLVLARSLLEQGELGRAETEIAELQRGLPNSAAVHTLIGNLQLRRKNYAAAKVSFERVLALAPGDLEAINGMLALDIQAKQFDAAVRRVDAELTKQPDRVELLALASGVYNQAGQSDRAEQALRRAVKNDPLFSSGYVLLAQLYLQQQRLDAARTEFEEIAKRDSKAVGPRTMVGVILEAQGKREDARRWYEATIAEIPNAPVVANNLAFIYAEQGTKLDVALQLASSAKQQMPDSASVDDTLGWVYYKKDLATMAVRSLEESRLKMPDNAEILYHLGMTYAKLGDKAKAREALERALKLSPQFAAAETARQTLLVVSQ
jgi:putative PEP-CTERM system TPR-repeat lipoprotein